VPKPGYASVTITKELYDALKEKYESEKQYWFNKGIRSFSAYVAYRLSELLEEDDPDKPDN